MRKSIFLAALGLFALLVLWRHEFTAKAGQGGGAGGTASENGDVNGDGDRDISDGIYLLSFLFQGGPPPVAIAGGLDDEVERLRISNPNGNSTLLFGPTDDCSLGIDARFPGLVERDPTGFRLLGRNEQGCRLLFGPTDDCTVEVNPQGPAGLLLRDPRGIRIFPPVAAGATSPARLLFGPTDDCSIGISPGLPGLSESDPFGFRLLGRNQQGCRLLFGPTDDCTIEVNPQGPSGLLLRDPRGIRILMPDAAIPCAVLRFGPTDDCSIGITPELSGLVESDPIGFRLLGRNLQGCRLLFGPTDDCTVEVDPQGPAGLLLRDPRGIRIVTPAPQPGQQPTFPTLLFGPTDDCSLGVDPAFPGLVERDPIGLRLMGRANQGCRLIFGPTMDCTVEVDPQGPAGLLLRDPRGIRILASSTAPGAPPTLLFGPTDDCSISVNQAAGGPPSGLLFKDPRGFMFMGGPVFASQFIPTSARRFKDDIEPLEDALETIEKLQGVSFRWNAENGGTESIGFIAEDVAKVLPDVVTFEADGKSARGLNYDAIVAVAVEGIKAQQQRITALESENTVLKDELGGLKSELSGLKTSIGALETQLAALLAASAAK